MAQLKKVSTTRWYIADPEHPSGRREVKPNTPGAVKERGLSATYFIVWKENGKTKRQTTKLSDKRAANVYLGDWEKARERGQVGVLDPHKPHLDRPAREHVAEYTRAVEERGRSAEYVAKLNKELGNILAAASIGQLRELTAEKVRDYLSRLKVEPGTKNKHRTYLFSFAEWLVKRDRLSLNPIARVETADTKNATKRKRRALGPKQLRTLVSAVGGYPLAAKSTNKGGRPRKDGSRPAPSVANLSEATRQALVQAGRERQLWYRTALLTGLRRGELSRVCVRHLRSKRVKKERWQVLDLPGDLTKNRKPAVIPLPATLAADLVRWVADTGRKSDDPLFQLPDAATVCVMHQRHLAHAGIDYPDKGGAFADWHSLRMSANRFLRKQDIPLRLRQRFLRHTAADLATKRYDDERLSELRPVVEKLGRLDKYLATPTEVV